MVYFLCKAYDSDRQNCYFALSLPVRGAWIEIKVLAIWLSSILSLPVRGAWIEIRLDRARRRAVWASLPVRGAWIEIDLRRVVSENTSSRSPCGERGLKYEQNLDWAYKSIVAPRAGSVD